MPKKINITISSAGPPHSTEEMPPLIAEGHNLCRELGVTRQTFYRHVGPAGELREDGRKLLQWPRR